MTSATANSGGVKQLTHAGSASRTLHCSLLLGLLVIAALGAEEPSYKPPPIICELRYHFRERLGVNGAGEKSVSAPSYEREVLPQSRINVSNGSVSQIVQGRSAHLPYRFVLKLTRKSEADHGTLEINVADVSGNSLPGFPRTITNPFTNADNSSRMYFEIPVSTGNRKTIERTLLAKGQFLTYVDLAIGTSE